MRGAPFTEPNGRENGGNAVLEAATDRVDLAMVSKYEMELSQGTWTDFYQC